MKTSSRWLWSAWVPVALVLSVPWQGRAEPGLVGQYYQGYSVVDGLIQFNNLTLTRTQVDTNWDWWNGSAYYDWNPIGGINYSVRWTGYILISQPGTYGFATISDDGSEVWLDNQLVVTNGEAQWYDWQESFVDLSAGYHPIEIKFYEGGVYSGIEVWWLLPGEPETPLAYSGETFHSIPPTFQPDTHWQLLTSDVLVTGEEVPRISAVPGDNRGQVDLVWPSLSNAVYRLEVSTNLSTWEMSSGPFPGTGDWMNWTVTSGRAREFFRLTVE